MVCTTKELASRMEIPVINERVSGGASVAECEQVLIDMAWFAQLKNWPPEWRYLLLTRGLVVEHL
jgi:hypothetical protein